MRNKSTGDWEREFSEFLAAPALSPPRNIFERVRLTISSELNPRARVVFVKLLGVTAASSILSLAVCPQFGFGNNFWLMRLFMGFGPYVCSIACGAIFVSIGVVFSFLILRPEELRVLRRTKFLQLSALSMLSLSGFVCAGAEVLIAVAMLWLLGAMVGGMIALEISYRIKFAQSGIRGF